MLIFKLISIRNTIEISNVSYVSDRKGHNSKMGKFSIELSGTGHWFFILIAVILIRYYLVVKVLKNYVLYLFVYITYKAILMCCYPRILQNIFGLGLSGHITTMVKAVRILESENKDKCITAVHTSISKIVQNFIELNKRITFFPFLFNG